MIYIKWHFEMRAFVFFTTTRKQRDISFMYINFYTTWRHQAAMSQRVFWIVTVELSPMVIYTAVNGFQLIVYLHVLRHSIPCLIKYAARITRNGWHEALANRKLTDPVAYWTSIWESGWHQEICDYTWHSSHHYQNISRGESHPKPQFASPDSKVHGANMGPIWGRQVPGGPHVGPMNLAIWVSNTEICYIVAWRNVW